MKPLDDHNLVSEELIRKVLGANISSLDCTREMLDLESSEPLLYEAMTDLIGTCTQGIADSFPLVRRHHPRILQDYMHVGQLVFLKGFNLGKQLMMEFFDDCFDGDDIDHPRPETNPKNFR